jgi:hypothetical protein
VDAQPAALPGTARWPVGALLQPRLHLPERPGKHGGGCSPQRHCNDPEGEVLKLPKAAFSTAETNHSKLMPFEKTDGGQNPFTQKRNRGFSATRIPRFWKSTIRSIKFIQSIRHTYQRHVSTSVTFGILIGGLHTLDFSGSLPGRKWIDACMQSRTVRLATGRRLPFSMRWNQTYS